MKLKNHDILKDKTHAVTVSDLSKLNLHSQAFEILRPEACRFNHKSWRTKNHEKY